MSTRIKEKSAETVKATTVDELKEILEYLSSIGLGDKPMVLAKDPRGSCFAPLAKSNTYDVGVYKPLTNWSGDFDGVISDEAVPYASAVALWPEG